MNIETAAAQLEALGNPTRLNIYRTLVRAGGSGLPVGKLQLKLDIAVNLVSQERQATTLICRANYASMNGLLGFLADECCADEAGTCAPASSEAAA